MFSSFVHYGSAAEYAVVEICVLPAPFQTNLSDGLRELMS
jgi:hypothetical protein